MSKDFQPELVPRIGAEAARTLLDLRKLVVEKLETARAEVQRNRGSGPWRMFEVETEKLELTVLRDDGLYRHLRFRNPKSSLYWFDLVTWPGALAIRGDMGNYMFARIEDMFEFFGDHRPGYINPGYWAEKCVSSGDDPQEYSAEVFTTYVLDDFADDLYLAIGYLYDEHDRTDDPEQAADAARKWWDIWEALEHDVLGYVHDEQEAYDAVSRFHHDDYEFVDTWDWDFRTYGYRFLVCLHAIVWGIHQYRAYKEEQTV